MGRIALSAILPTLEERQNIEPLLVRLEAALAGIPHEVVVVDDDSRDGTGDAVEAYGRAHPGVALLRRRGQTGLCSAIRDGIARSSGDVVVWMDCDLSMPPEVVPALYAAVAAGADIAVGSRYVPGGRDARTGVPLHRVMSRGLNLFLRALLRSGLTDYTSGFVCARRTVLERIPLAGRHGEYCIDLLHRARLLGLRVVELPYENTPRAHGASKTGTSLGGLLRQGAKYVTLAFRLRAVR